MDPFEECLNSTSLFWPTDSEITRSDSLYTTMTYGAICHLALGGLRGKLADVYATIDAKFFKKRDKKDMLRVVALVYYILVIIGNFFGMIEHINCTILFIPAYSLYALPYQMSNALYVAMLLQITARVFTICKKTIKASKLSLFEVSLERYSFVSPFILLVSVVATYTDPQLMWTVYSYKLLVECCIIFLVITTTVYYFNTAGVGGRTGTIIRMAIIRAACSAIPLVCDVLLNQLTTGGFAPAWVYRIIDYVQLLIVARFISPSLPPTNFEKSSLRKPTKSIRVAANESSASSIASSSVVRP